MAYKISLAMLSVVPLCSGAPLNPRLQEFLTWFLDNQRTIDRSIESGSTVVEDTTTETTTESNFKSPTVDTTLINIASTTTTEQITTTAAAATTTTTTTPAATSAISACDGMISISMLKYIGLLLAFLTFLCVMGLVVFKTLRWCRNRKSKSVKQPDIEEGKQEQDPAELDGNRTRPCNFWYPEMQNKSKSEGFVTLSDSGEIVDVKHWSMQQLDAYFAEKSCLKDKGFLH